MNMTRKRFLALASSAAALAAAKPLRLLASPAPRVVGFRSENFRQLQGKTFTLNGPGGAVRLVLQDVRDGPQDRLTEQFSVVFVSEDGVVLPQGTYPVTFPDRRTLDVFVVPAGAGAAGVTFFRADFNLLR